MCRWVKTTTPCCGSRSSTPRRNHRRTKRSGTRGPDGTSMWSRRPTAASREQEVLRLRFGLGTDAEEHTLADIARRLSLSRERVRQIEAKAIAKLRPGHAA